MKDKNFERYADIINDIKELEVEASDIKEKLISELEKEGFDKIDYDFGSFYFSSRRKYIYSGKVKDLEDKVKQEKKKEEESGAEFEETKSLTFRSK